MKKNAHQALLAGLLLLLPAVVMSAYGQGLPPEIRGTYTNQNFGVEITFPAGWSGFEVVQNPTTLLVATSPGAMSEPDPQTMKSISLLVTEKGPRDINDPTSYSADAGGCNEPSISSRTVAGVQGTELTLDCPETSQKMRFVILETGDNVVNVMFVTPASEFDSNIAAFDSAVASLQVQGATGTGGTPTDEVPGESMRSVMVGGESIEVYVNSPSTVSAFALNEESKMLSFKTDGTGTETTVAVGSVLEGPYTVMVDGEATTDFEESTDTHGTKTITTRHGTGAHDVSISGTQVVPEFPLAALGSVAALVGVITVLGRTKLFKK